MRLRLGGRLIRGGALVVGTAVALSSGITFLTPARAATNNVGSLSFAPATGTDKSVINLTTVSKGQPAGCPSGTTNVKGVVNGPGSWTNITVVGNTSTGVSTTSDFTEPLADTFSGIASSNGLAITAGRYDVSLICQNRLGTTVFGTFDAPIFFIDATHYQSTNPNAQSTSTVVTAAPSSPQVAGTSVTFTATLTPSNAAGTVQFKDGGTNLGSPQTVSSGHATLSTSSLATGSHSISAVFTPTDSNAFSGSTSAAVTYVINAPAQSTSTVVTAAPSSPQVAGTAVTFTATVSPAAAGTVQFKDGGTNLGSTQPVSSGQATLTTSSLAAGSHSITGVFVPTNPSAFTGSTSAAITYVISAPAQSTSTVVTAAPSSPQVVGTSVTFTATLTPSSAAGTVQFKDGGTNLGSAQTVSSGKAMLATSSLAVGSHSISAVFTPTDSNAFTGSTSAAITYVISAPAATQTTTALSANPASPQVAGTSVTFTATVSPAAAGTVQFKDGAANLGSTQPVSGGQATLTTSSLAAGSHSITAVFVPTDPSAFTGSTSPALPYTISPAPPQNTTTTLAVSPASPAMAGVPVTFTATVSPAAAGTVQFKDGGTNLGSTQPVSSGQASLTTSSLAVGSHSITAVFAPSNSGAFNGSTSADLPYTISPAPPQSTSTAVGSNPPSPAVAGTSVTFTATVSPAAAGTVQFKDGATSLGSAQPVSSGHASISTSALTVGSHSITGVFTPTDPSAFNGSTSPVSTYVINAPATATTTSLSANPASPSAAGTSVTFTATVAPSAAAGAVQFKDGGTNLGAPQTLSGGQATLSTSTLTVGTHSITAVFTPTDSNAFTGSTSAALSYVITGQANSDLGNLTFAPTTGTDTSPIQLTTHSTGATPGCPSPATNVRASVNGPTGWTNIPVVGNTSTGVSNTADFTLPMADTFTGIANSNGINITAGKYDFTLYCQNRLGTTTYGTFVGSLWFTDPTHYQSTDPSNTVTTTTTQLTVTPDARQDIGKPITLVGSVTPTTAVGAIQFKDTVNGATNNLGAPVPVSNPPAAAAIQATSTLATAPAGTATLVTSSLPFGLHTFSATFIPADSKKFSTSKSDNVAYVVALPAPPKLVTPAHLLGNGHPGTILTCASTFQGATSYAYSWLRNGAPVPGASSSTYRVGLADRWHFVACKVIAHNAGGNTPSTSRPIFAGLLTFKLLVPPKIFGQHKVGSWLIAGPGQWAPTPTQFFYVWLRDGKAIGGAFNQFYKVSPADMGHKISVQVTVYLWFLYYPAVAVSQPI